MALVLSLSGAVAVPIQPTPPMGWMSWQVFRCETDCATHPDSCINDALYRGQADRMAADGYLAAGYSGIHIDDCWPEMQRDSSGRLVPDAARFPAGMKALGDYIHSKDLTFGIYSAAYTTPLSDLVDEAIRTSPVDVRRSLYGSIVLAGGSTMFANFSPRLQRDVKRLVTARYTAAGIAEDKIPRPTDTSSAVRRMEPDEAAGGASAPSGSGGRYSTAIPLRHGQRTRSALSAYHRASAPGYRRTTGRREPWEFARLRGTGRARSGETALGLRTRGRSLGRPGRARGRAWTRDIAI